MREEVGRFGWLEEDASDFESKISDEIDLELNSYMHHDITVSLDWLIRVISGLWSTVVGIFVAVSYLQSNFYYFEMGYVFAETFA
jgi:hypothetical protein